MNEARGGDGKDGGVGRVSRVDVPRRHGSKSRSHIRVLSALLLVRIGGGGLPGGQPEADALP